MNSAYKPISKFTENCIGGVMISIVGSGPDQVKPKTMKLIAVASQLSMQY